jgi:hypothetical protein
VTATTITTNLNSSGFSGDPADGTMSYPKLVTNLDATGAAAFPDTGRIILLSPVWPALRQVHGKGTKRWPKGTKGNLVQMHFQGTGMGETKINRIITYYKIISRAI